MSDAFTRRKILKLTSVIPLFAANFVLSGVAFADDPNKNKKELKKLRKERDHKIEKARDEYDRDVEEAEKEGKPDKLERAEAKYEEKVRKARKKFKEKKAKLENK